MGKSKMSASEDVTPFLFDYGWALLASIIAIGVLAYFGVFSPSNYLRGEIPSDNNCLANSLCLSINESYHSQNIYAGWVKCDKFQNNGIYEEKFYYVNESMLKNNFPECKINLSNLNELR